MSNTDRWEKRRKLHSDNSDEYYNMMRLHEYDMYDQALQNLKHLVNERRKIEPDKRTAYDLAIDQAIFDLHERMHDEIPKTSIDHDIKLALQGGKYRSLYRDPTDDSDNDVIQLRKKKSSKTKPKRQLTKKRVTKNPVKKVTKKPKHK